MVFSLSFTCTAGADVGPDYVITKGPTTETDDYYVYSSADSSTPISTYSSITAAMSAVTTEVVSGSTTLFFGLTGSSTSGVTGTLVLGIDEYVNLGSAGTYTLKGGLSGSSENCTLYMNGASVIVDGATLANTRTVVGDVATTIYNAGSGSITVQSGMVTSSSGSAIWNNSTGKVTVTGGTVTAQGLISAIYIAVGGSVGNTVLEMTGGSVTNTCTSSTDLNGFDAVAIWNDNCGTVKIRGGTVIGGTNGNGVQNNSTGDINISDGTIDSDVAGVYNLSTGHIHLSSTPSISGNRADIYTGEPSTIVANDGAETPTYYGGDALGVYYGGVIIPGTTVAVSGVSGNSDKFTCSTPGYAFTLDGTGLVMDTAYDYVITGTTDSFNVYRSLHGADSFSSFGGSPYSAINDAMSAITAAVGSGTTTLYFGGNMTGTTASTVSGTLDIGSEDVELGSAGTYTLKGGLTCSDDTYTLNLGGASAVVDGATLINTNADAGGGNTLENSGAGSITILSGTVTSLGGNAIRSKNEIGSSGAITISGGAITGSGDDIATVFLGNSANADTSLTVNGGSIIHEGSGSAVTNEGTGEINISGGSLSLSNYSGQSAALVVSNSCTVNISGNALLDNDGPGAAIGIFPLNSSTISPVINIAGGRVKSTQAGYAIYSYDYFTAGTVNISGGTVENTGTGDAVYNGAGHVKICGGTVSGGTGKYGVYNAPNGCVYLSSTPSITGGTAGLYTASESTVVANDGETSPTDYSGAAVSVYYGGSITSGTTVAVSGVVGNSDKFTCANTGYDFTLDGSDLVISEASGGNGSSSSYARSTSSRTITVDEVTAGVFDDTDSSLFGAKANMNNAFSNSVEVKITDSEDADTSAFKLAGANGEVYPFDISLYIKGTTTKTQPADGYSVTITLPLPEALWDDLDNLSIARLNDSVLTTLDFTLEQVDGVWCIVFETNHFSPYALVVNNTWENPYGDVAETDWFYDAVEYVTETGLMNGTGDVTFSPGIDTSRAMIVTILWRMEGEPEVGSSGIFPDVAEGLWYTGAVEWAAENGIVTGYTDGNYGPDGVITREQLAAILYRYAQYKGYDVSVGGETNILSFEDALSLSEYAFPAMQWACGAGLLEGSGGSISPQGGATRAQLAAVLMRFSVSGSR